jgi:ABC-2 type transport system ATP-binding protein
MSVALQISQLTKIFRTGFIPKRTIAVDGISLDVQKGEIFGLLGPNGAGKPPPSNAFEPGSTDLRDHSSAGRSDSFEEPWQGSAFWQKIRMCTILTGHKISPFSGKLHGYDSGTCRRKADELLSFFHLEDAAKRQLRKYSKECFSGSVWHKR